IKNPSDHISYGNILFTGDAANQNLKPFVEGILPGIICGYSAGKSAVRNLQNINNLGPDYLKIIREKIGELLKESDEIGNFLVKIYKSRKSERFLLELATFAYIVEHKDLKKIEKLDERGIEAFIKDRQSSNS
ncbi:MAG: hypothetical protein J7L32_02355, partial [Thermoplasmata archaeon]|nr:hypothetical protein [Thermoplasmata archaeon]